MRAVHFVVPDGIEDAARPSGGNTYDRNLRDGLSSIGWSVHEHAVPGFWSAPDPASFAALEGAMRAIPDGACAMLDGLFAPVAPEVLVPHARRLRLTVLVHMPLGHRAAGQAAEAGVRERAVLSAANAVITTSAWSRRLLTESYALPADRVHVAEPGVSEAELAPGTVTGGALLCVAAVTRLKGHDVLLDGLARIGELDWHCTCVGSLDRDPEFVDALLGRARAHGLASRVRFAGAAATTSLDRAYAAADVLLLASRSETYGMVITEALARGLPVIATRVGGVAEALGCGGDGSLPGLLVPADDPEGLAGALRWWLSDGTLRGRLRRVVRERRESLRRWTSTTSIVAGVLRGLDR